MFLLVFTAICLTLNAQNNLKSTGAVEPIKINKDSTATVLHWFKLIEKTGVVLSYNSTNINLYERVKIKRDNYNLDKLLNTILEKYEFETRFLDKKILLQITGAKRTQISGLICDKITNEPLEGCIVRFETKNNTNYIAITDSKGFFSKTLPYEDYQLKASYIGYEPYTDTYLKQKILDIRIGMVQTAIPLNEVKVSNAPVSDIINYKGVSSMLSVNEKDPFAQIQVLPGIHGSSASGNMHVNGGQNDENLILLDGISIYHSHHNNTLLSQFNGEMVEKVSFYDSFIPAQYEGRLSSVTDVKIKGGNPVQHHQSIGLDLPSASLTFDGPIIKNKLTYMLSGRHSWIDFMKDLFSDDAKASRTFNDIAVKLLYHLRPNLSVEGLIYNSSDKYKDSINNIRNHKILGWVNSIYSLSSHSGLPKEISNTSSVSFSKYSNSIYGPAINIPSGLYINEGMKNVTVKSNFAKKVDNYMDMSWGLTLSHEKYNLLASQDTVKNNLQNVTQISSYLNSKIMITDKLFGSVALNLVSYLPRDNKSFFSMQPRFTLKYAADNKNIFSVDFSRMEQFYHNICVGEIPIPTDLRMPSINGFKPSSSVHTEIGWKHLHENWRASISTFYKRRYHILGIRYKILDTGIEGWDRFIMQGNAENYGIKIHSMSRWEKWRLDWSYTFSRSVEWFEDYDNKKKNPALHDVPHILHCAASYSVGNNSFLSLGGYVKSGTLVNVYNDDEDMSPEFISNRQRRKFNYRLDLNYSSSITSKNHRLKFSYKVGLYNIIGNPKENEVIDLFSIETKKHCLPYFSMNVKL